MVVRACWCLVYCVLWLACRWDACARARVGFSAGGRWGSCCADVLTLHQCVPFRVSCSCLIRICSDSACVLNSLTKVTTAGVPISCVHHQSTNKLTCEHGQRSPTRPTICRPSTSLCALQTAALGHPREFLSGQFLEHVVCKPCTPTNRHCA